MQYVNLSLQSPQSLQVAPSLFRAIVFSGPLGSGKTTLFNQFLRQAGDVIGSYVVIENDIGSKNIDKARLNADPGRILALTSGCICCNDISSFRFHVSRMKELPREDQPETLLVETTGIAHPSEVKRALYELNVPSLMIVTVDVAHYTRNERLRPNKQGILSADVVAFTWWDHLQDSVLLSDVVRSVEDTNPYARKLFVKANGEIFEMIGGHQEIAATALQDGTAKYGDLPLDHYDLGNLTYNWIKSDGKVSLEDSHSPGAVVSAPHVEKSISLSFHPHLSANEIIAAVSEVAGGDLVRVKGRLGKEEVDCTHGDWKIEQRTHGAINTLNIITATPIDLTRLEHLIEKVSGDEEIDLSAPTAMKQAIDLVEDLIRDFPEEVISPRGNLTTECDSGEGWRYIYKEGFPEDVRNRFLAGLVHFYHQQIKTLQNGTLDTHPSLPFYMKEVGANVSWLLIDCSELLSRLGLNEEIEESRPFSLYFQGLRSLTLPGQLNRLRPQDLTYLDARVEGLIREVGPVKGREEIRAALNNAERLSSDGSWKSIIERYSHLL